MALSTLRDRVLFISGGSRGIGRAARDRARIALRARELALDLFVEARLPE